jgi:hypothetical protein
MACSEMYILQGLKQWVLLLSHGLKPAAIISVFPSRLGYSGCWFDGAIPGYYTGSSYGTQLALSRVKD